MAQVLKADVRDAILSAGRAEFLAHGFQGASMRGIAKGAGVGPSNVYNYFENKDALFVEIVTPCIMAFYGVVEAVKSSLPANGDALLEYLERQENFREAVDFIDTHREDVTLLVLKGEGSSAVQFQEAAIQAYESVWFNYFDHLRQSVPEEALAEVSPFFVHNIARFYFNTLVEFLRRDLSRDEMMTYADELLRYANGGVRGLLAPSSAQP